MRVYGATIVCPKAAMEFAGSIRRSPKRDSRTTTISISQPPSSGHVSTICPISSPLQS